MLRSFVLLGCLVCASIVGRGQTEVSHPLPVIHTLTLSNVRAIAPSEQQRIVRDVLHQVEPAVHGKDNEFFNEIAERIRFEFQRIGYFKVFVTDPVVKAMVKAIGKDGEREIVDVDIRIVEGEQYRLKDIHFVNNTVSSTAVLRAAFAISDGDIFDRAKIGAGLEGLRQTYAQQGYVNFSAVPETDIDEAAHAISLSIDVDEGHVFRWGTLSVQGVESKPGARDKLLRTWGSYEGKEFDPRLLQQFLRDLGARPSVKPEQIFRISFDEQTQVANVSIMLVNPPLF
jgi:Surface antigen variable number repeat